MRPVAFCKRLIITLDWRLSGMTEREKMINGELYDSADKELEQLQTKLEKGKAVPAKAVKATTAKTKAPAAKKPAAKKAIKKEVTK